MWKYNHYVQLNPMASRPPFAPKHEYAVTAMPLLLQNSTSSGCWRYRWFSTCKLSGLILQLSSTLCICWTLKFDNPIAFARPQVTCFSIIYATYNIYYHNIYIKLYWSLHIINESQFPQVLRIIWYAIHANA